jgi:cytochrome c-type biogenesis protein CcmH/NrfG
MNRFLALGFALAASAAMGSLAGCRNQVASGDMGAAQIRVRQQPNTPDAWVSLGKAYLKAQRYNDAFIAYRGALRIDEHSFEALCGLGEASVRLGDAQGALQWAGRALERKPDDPKALGLRGRARLAMGQTDQALPDLERAASLDPSDLETRLALVSAYRTAQQPDRALNQAAKVAAQFPEEARAHYVYAALLDAGGRLPEAEQEYRQALRLDGSMTGAKFALALALIHQNKHLDEARRLAAEVDAAQPGDGTAAGLAAWALFASGKQEQGLRELAMVYKKHPGNVQVVVWIKSAALKAGNTDLAEAASKTLQAMGASPPQ